MGSFKHRTWFRLGLALVGIALPCVAAAATTTERECLDSVPELCLVTEKQATGARLLITNTTSVPYTVRVAIEGLDNLSASKPSPVRAVVAPMETKRIAAFRVVNAGEPYGYDLHWGAGAGSLLARHDNAWHYRMPFGGKTPYPVSQSVDGDMSHKGPYRHSFDFALPRGTPVLAGRSGIVVRVEDGGGRFGRLLRSFEDANAVDVLHRDGTIATYAHLGRSISVRVGDAVATGDTLARSGDTGLTTGPHLHFMVWRRNADLSQSSLPIRFHDGSRTGFVPGEGIAYAPGCAPSGLGCPRDQGPPPSEMWPASGGLTPAAAAGSMRRPDGSCQCGNGAVIRVEGPSCAAICGN